MNLSAHVDTAASPARWASLLTAGWACAVFFDDSAALAWPGVARLVTFLGRWGLASVLTVAAVLPCFAYVTHNRGVRLASTSLPLALWVLILFDAVSNGPPYKPAVFTGLVCVLTLLEANLRWLREGR